MYIFVHRCPRFPIALEICFGSRGPHHREAEIECDKQLYSLSSLSPLSVAVEIGNLTFPWDSLSYVRESLISEEPSPFPGFHRFQSSQTSLPLAIFHQLDDLGSSLFVGGSLHNKRFRVLPRTHENCVSKRFRTAPHFPVCIRTMREFGPSGTACVS